MVTLDSLDSALHSVEIKNAAGQALAIDGSGYLTIANTSFAVTATQLDIDDLSSAVDNVEIRTAAGQALAIDGSGFITSNINGSVTVTATQLDIDDLDSASDSVEIKTAAGQALDIDGSGYITANINGVVNTTPAAFDSWQVSATTATSTAAELAATPLTSRLKIMVQNLGSNDVYLGPDGTVTTSTGFKLPKGSSYSTSFGTTGNLFAITASGSADLRVVEFAD